MRNDLTKLKVYVIDPLNCEDADDAFSIEIIDEKINLWIFIADPTNEFNINDLIYKKIIDQGITKYSLFEKPINLFPKEIIEKCSLNKGIKNAIGVLLILDKSLEIIENKIDLVKIKIEKHLVYEETEIDENIELAIKISEKFYNDRKGNGKILNDYQLALPKLINNKWKLILDNPKTIKIKKIISEFAIKTNQIIAEKLNINLNRICNFNYNCNYNNPFQIIHKIINDGINAKYQLSNEHHQLIDNKIYTHFTSPLRRANDCLVHFLLKGYNIKLDEIEKITERINIINKEDKKRQYEEIKKASLMALNEMEKPIEIKLRLLNSRGIFINFILYKINELDSQISITIRRNNFNINEKEYKLKVYKINLNGKYDEEIIPILKTIE